jgi:hypothetical protein
MKKRPFLAPLTFSVAALLGTIVGGNALARSLFSTHDSVAAQAAGPSVPDSFVITRTSDSGQFGQHTSHASHGSHDSHGSHGSHQSHGSHASHASSSG